MKSLLHRPFFIRLLNWEYWPFWAVYTLITPIWFWLALRARSFFFFNAANPGIENGGFVMESKKKIYDILPPGAYPRTLFFPATTTWEQVEAALQRDNFCYPLYAKPDVGGMGRGVKKLIHPLQLKQYLESAGVDFLVQEAAGQPMEIGLFYYRLPGRPTGRISGIVRKELLAVKGDGQSSIREILLRNPRAILQFDTLERYYGDQLETILAPGEEKELVPYGNHARGAMFLDETWRVDPQLTQAMDQLCQRIEGFYYGRLDIRFNSWEELRQGLNYSIIELNGAGSEPTHIYDPRHSLFFAWREIVRHWVLLWRISRINHRRGIPYLSHRAGLRLLRDNQAFEKKLDSIYV